MLMLIAAADAAILPLVFSDITLMPPYYERRHTCYYT